MSSFCDNKLLIVQNRENAPMKRVSQYIIRMLNQVYKIKGIRKFIFPILIRSQSSSYGSTITHLPFAILFIQVTISSFNLPKNSRKHMVLLAPA